MSKALILKLREKRDADVASANTFLKKIEEGTELTESETKNLEDLTKSATALDERIKELTALETARIEASEVDLKFDRLSTQHSSGLQIREREKAPMDLGSQFSASEGFKNYAKAPAGNSSIMDLEFSLPSRYAVATAIVTGDLPPVSRASDVESGQQKTPLLDAMSREPVSSNSIEWIEWPIDPVAGVVAENVTKPEATYAPQLRTGSLNKIAHHLPFTREVLEDVPRFKAMVNGALLRGVRRKAELDAALSLVAATLPAYDGDVSLTASVRTAMATVESAGFTPDTVVLNPFDYAAVDIDLLSATLAGARVNSTIWGVNIVSATAVAAGTAYVGDFKTGMTLFDRGNLAVYMTDSHAAEFTDNVLRILAEARMKAIVTMPAALCEATFTPVVVP